MQRCPWALSAPDYVEYHDNEWGRLVHDEVRVFEKLCLEGFQSGLSWLVVLRKREAFRRAFHGFDPEAMSRLGPSDVDRLVADQSIIRHRGKIEAVVSNARALLDWHEKGLTLAGALWAAAPANAPAPPATVADIPASTLESKKLSDHLRRSGFRFVGPTTVYSAMQALGVVNDHIASCWCRDRWR